MHLPLLAILFLEASLGSASPLSSQFSVLLWEWLIDFLNSLTSSRLRSINCTGFLSQLAFGLKFWFWSLSPNWALLQNISGITIARHLCSFSSTSLNLDWHVFFVLRIHSLIHSFISNIYIAPLQENYSEALPTPARLKRAVLGWEKNAGDKALGEIRSWVGSPFQIKGPTT